MSRRQDQHTCGLVVPTSDALPANHLTRGRVWAARRPDAGRLSLGGVRIDRPAGDSHNLAEPKGSGEQEYPLLQEHPLVNALRKTGMECGAGGGIGARERRAPFADVIDAASTMHDRFGQIVRGERAKVVQEQQTAVGVVAGTLLPAQRAHG